MKNTLCTECNAKVPTLKTRLARVNNALHKLGLTYHASVPWHAIDTVLETNGFNLPTYDQKHERPGGSKFDFRTLDEVGEGKWLTVAVHQMESGRYEVTAYVN